MQKQKAQEAAEALNLALKDTAEGGEKLKVGLF